LLERMVSLSKEIERLFGTFRAEVDGQRLSNNDLLERWSHDHPRRQKIWRTQKSAAVAESWSSGPRSAIRRRGNWALPISGDADPAGNTIRPSCWRSSRNSNG
jgi:hypothetical protein